MKVLNVLSLALIVFTLPACVTTVQMNKAIERANADVLKQAKKDAVDTMQVYLAGASLPVGTIVASPLPFKSFKQAAGDPDLWSQSSKWSPADGRNVDGSKFATLSKNTSVPDLRGMFIRGLNIFDSIQPVPPVSADRRDPENRLAGHFQSDLYKEHQHGFGGNFINSSGTLWQVFGSRSSSTWQAKVNGQSVRQSNRVSLTSPEGGTETRPKNVAVYYYIKIN